MLNTTNLFLKQLMGVQFPDNGFIPKYSMKPLCYSLKKLTNPQLL